MADPSDLWKEFESIGPEDVRKRIGAHIWREEKERLARQWLEHHESAAAREANALASEANLIARDASESARRSAEAATTNNIIATIALVAAFMALGISIIGIFLKK